MEQEQGIGRLSDYISGIEAGIQKKEVYYADISTEFSAQQNIISAPQTRKENNTLFENLQQLLLNFEAARQRGGARPQTEQAQKAAPQAQPLHGVQFPAGRNREEHEVPSASQSASSMQAGISKRLSPIETDMARIEEEIKKIAAAEIKNISEIKVRPKPGANSKSILVTLSLQDQVSELEKIIAGLNSGSFNEAQIRIVTQELNALYKAVQSQPAHGGIGQELAGLRNSRLDAAMRALEDAETHKPQILNNVK